MNITNSQIHIGAIYIYSGPQGYIVQGGQIGPSGTVGLAVPEASGPSGPSGPSIPLGPQTSRTVDISGNIVLGPSGTPQ